MNVSSSNSPVIQAGLIRVKGADEAEATSKTPEAAEQPKEAPMQADARSGASPAMYA